MAEEYSVEELKAQLVEQSRQNAALRAENERLNTQLSGKIKAAIAGQSKPKDTSLKLFFKNNQVFAEAFNNTVFQDSPIDPSCLVDMDTDEASIISVGNHNITLQLFRDVEKGMTGESDESVLGAKTMKVGNEEQMVLAILGEENQMHVDYKMPLRVMQTQFISYSRQANIIEQRNRKSGLKTSDADQSGEFVSHFLKTDRIIRVICLVIYYGEIPWDGPMSLEEMFVPSGLPSLGESNPLHLLDLRHMTETELSKYSGALRPFIGYLMHDSQGDTDNYVSANTELFNDLSPEATNALIEITGSDDLERIKEEYTTESGGVNLVDGLKRVVENAEKKGADHMLHTVAERMIRAGKPGEEISLFTSLGRQDINTIAMRMNRTVSWG